MAGGVGVTSCETGGIGSGRRVWQCRHVEVVVEERLPFDVRFAAALAPEVIGRSLAPNSTVMLIGEDDFVAVLCLMRRASGTAAAGVCTAKVAMQMLRVQQVGRPSCTAVRVVLLFRMC